MANLFDDLPSALSAELVDILVETPEVRIERIISTGHASPSGFWYDQTENEWVVLLRGSARLQFEHEAIDLRPGDHVKIPAHQRHRVESTSEEEPTIWLAVFYR